MHFFFHPLLSKFFNSSFCFGLCFVLDGLFSISFPLLLLLFFHFVAQQFRIVSLSIAIELRSFFYPISSNFFSLLAEKNTKTIEYREEREEEEERMQGNEKSHFLECYKSVHFFSLIIFPCSCCFCTF